MQPATRIVMALLAFAAVLALAACGGHGSSRDSTGRLIVVATIAPAGAIVAAVGGDHVAVRVLAGAGVDPHAYEVRTGDRKAIDRAALIVRMGAGIDAFLDKPLKTDGAGDKTLTLTDSIVLRGAGSDEGGKDPHAWHDPARVKQMAAAVASALGSKDPANATAYERNLAAYGARLDDADAQVRALIDSIPPAQRKVVTNHDTLGYFIDRYGLVYVGAVIPNLTTQSEPSAKQIAQLSDLIRREGVRAIFAEATVDPRVAKQVAKDTGATIVDDLYGDSLGPPGSGAETIEGMLVINATKIAEALR